MRVNERHWYLREQTLMSIKYFAEIKHFERLERFELLEHWWVAAGSLETGFGSLAEALEVASLVTEIKEDLGRALKSYAKL
jgi:hypothetical protein